jgi:hypothetical protein
VDEVAIDYGWRHCKMELTAYLTSVPILVAHGTVWTGLQAMERAASGNGQTGPRPHRGPRVVLVGRAMALERAVCYFGSKEEADRRFHRLWLPRGLRSLGRKRAKTRDVGPAG